MKKLMMRSFLGLNAILLAVVLTTSPQPAAAASAGAGWADCCENSTEGIGFCCDNCCWWDNCDYSSQCGDIMPR